MGGSDIEGVEDWLFAALRGSWGIGIPDECQAAVLDERLQTLVQQIAQPETNRLWRTICRWWKEIEVLVVTGATTAKVEANNTLIKHINQTHQGFGGGFTNALDYKTRILLRRATGTAA